MTAGPVAERVIRANFLTQGSNHADSRYGGDRISGALSGAPLTWNRDTTCRCWYRPQSDRSELPSEGIEWVPGRLNDAGLDGRPLGRAAMR